MSSLQHKLDRVRRPRVQITYDVETNGAMQKTELPFVVGVLADLSAQSTQPQKPLKDRKVVTIDRDNFDEVLARSAPRLAMRVDNTLTNEGKLNVELNFKSMDDFSPDQIAQQVGPLRELLRMRQELSQLMSKMEGNDKLEELLSAVLSSTETARGLAQHLGVAGTETAPGETPKGGDE